VADHPITREDALRNVASFDLAKLRAGQLAGVDLDRLSFLRESVHSLPLESGSVDVTTSVAFLEHLPRMDGVAEELARVTRRGGMGIHVIDATDHLRYWRPEVHPLAFLAVEPGAELVHDSNRLRPVEFVPVFERHGFEVLSLMTYQTAAVDEALRRTFVAPWRSMSVEDLRVGQARIVIRKK
jgi:SAM-dependent methyltransferase